MYWFSDKIKILFVVSLIFLLSGARTSYAVPDPHLTGGSAVSGFSNVATPVTDLQVTGTGNPTVPVKLHVTSGTLAMGTTTGLTFTGSSTGSTLQFSGTLANVNTALATLTYTRSGTGTDTIEASLVNAGEVFFSGNGHLYEYVSYNGTWTQAKSQAEGRTKYGATGYLTTITSQEENDFVADRLSNAGWMGASDASSEGDWKWVTGPENGTSFWSGNYTGSAVSGRYQNWNTGEPNDAGSNEDCGQFLSGSGGEWNDLPCSTYSLPGYVVEYGSDSSPIDVSSVNVSVTTVANATPSVPSSLAPSGLVTGGRTNDTTPTITFSLSDSNDGQTVKYHIQIDDTVDFSSPIVDYTSSLAAQGSRAYTFGTTSNSGETLADGNYYVRIRAIDALDAASSYVTANSGGVAFTVDTVAPTLTSLSPVDGATRVSRNVNFIVTFNEPVVGNSAGAFVIRRSSDQYIVETIDPQGARVSGSGTTALTIDPTTALSSETGYYIEITTNAVEDVAGNAYAGIANETTWNFTTEDVTAPVVSSLSPADGASEVSRTTDVVLTLNEVVVAGTGNVFVRRASDGSTVATIDVASGQVSGAGTSAITLRTGVTLDYNTAYFVQIDSGAFADTSGNEYVGISDTTTWNFTTESEPAEGEDLEVYNVSYETTETALTVKWKTNNKADSTLEYGTTREMTKDESDNHNEKNHSVTVDDLKPGTRYYFRVSSEDENGSEDRSRIYSVITEERELAMSVSVARLTPASDEIPRYQELLVQAGDQPVSETSVGQGEDRAFDPVETPKQIQKATEKLYATEVFEKDGQQYIKEVKFQVLDGQGNPLSGLPVTLHSEPRTGVTDDYGTVVFEDVPTGEHRILFAYAGRELEKTVTINDLNRSFGPVKAEVIIVTAVKDPLPWWMFGIILVLIAFCLILFFLLMKKRRKAGAIAHEA